MKYVVIVLLTIFLLCTGCTEDTLGDSTGCSAVKVTSAPYVALITGDLCFSLVPTDKAVAGKKYKVILYKHGEERERTYVSWTGSQIDVKKEGYACFDLAMREGMDYQGEDLRGIFKIKVLDCE